MTDALPIPVAERHGALIAALDARACEAVAAGDLVSMAFASLFRALAALIRALVTHVGATVASDGRHGCFGVEPEPRRPEMSGYGARAGAGRRVDDVASDNARTARGCSRSDKTAPRLDGARGARLSGRGRGGGCPRSAPRGRRAAVGAAHHAGVAATEVRSKSVASVAALARP